MIAMGFPLLYIQREGLLDELGGFVRALGSRPLVVADAYVQDAFKDRYEASLRAAGMEPVHYRFSGECSPRAIDEVVAAAKAGGCDMSIGMGGGKALDTAKAVKLDLGLPVALVPTVASNDAPTSRLIITYTDEGAFIGPRALDFNPDAVLVDTGLIASAPVRFLVAGIGDALATVFEAEQCLGSGALNYFQGRPTEAAMAIARRCYELLREYGVDAVDSVRQGRVSEALDKVVESNVLLSGLGFEGCGVAGAHAVAQGLTKIPGCHGVLHGEEVAVGLIVQLVLEGRSDAEILDMLGFYNAIGLPCTAADLSATPPTEEEFQAAASFASREGSRIHNMIAPVTRERVLEGFRRAQELTDRSRAA